MVSSVVLSKSFKRISSVALCSLFLNFSCQAMNIEEIEYQEGWTGSFTFFVRKDTNLTQTPLQFDIDGQTTVSSIWGLSEAPLTCSQIGNRVTVCVGQRWYPQGDLIVNEDKHLTLSFSPSHNYFHLSNFCLGNENLNVAASPLPLTIIPQEQVLPNEPVIFPTTASTVPFCPYVDITLNNVTKWSQEQNSMQPDLYTVITDTKLNKLRLAFITSKPGICEPTFAGYDVDSGFGSKTCKELKGKGVELTISLGGANGTYLEQTCTSVAELTNAYRQIILAYNPKGLDFDLEGYFEKTHSSKLNIMMEAIKTIQCENSDLDISFTLPVLPEGLVPGNGLGILEKAVAYDLNFAINIMAMDYGPHYSSKSMGQYAIDAATATQVQLKQAYENKGVNLSTPTLWSKIQVTPMIGINDTAPQNFSLDDARQLKIFAEDVGLGMLSCWSLNRDHSGNSPEADPLSSGLNPITHSSNQIADWEYIKLFSGQ